MKLQCCCNYVVLQWLVYRSNTTARCVFRLESDVVGRGPRLLLHICFQFAKICHNVRVGLTQATSGLFEARDVSGGISAHEPRIVLPNPRGAAQRLRSGRWRAISSGTMLIELAQSS
jgi:hypothetical protein